MITRSRFAADQNAARNHAFGFSAFDPIVEMNAVQSVEQLTLVLVNSLDLNIKHERRIELHAGCVRDIPGQSFLVVLFNRHPTVSEGRVIKESFNPFDVLQILLPLFAD